MIKIKVYDQWNKKWMRELQIFGSNEIKELNLCCVAQGYEDRIFNRAMVLFGSGFVALNVIKNLREIINE